MKRVNPSQFAHQSSLLHRDLQSISALSMKYPFPDLVLMTLRNGKLNRIPFLSELRTFWKMPRLALACAAFKLASVISVGFPHRFTSKTT